MIAPRALAAGLVAAFAIGLVVGTAPAASAEDTASSSCTRSERAELRAEMASLRAQIVDLRLTAEEVAAKKAELRKAVAALRAEYGLPGAKLTDAQRAELKAAIATLMEKAREEQADRRASIDPLKSQLRDTRRELAACMAG